MQSITRKVKDNYEKHEADIAMTIEDEKGFIDGKTILKAIDEVKQLVQETLSPDPSWIQEKSEAVQKQEAKNAG